MLYCSLHCIKIGSKSTALVQHVVDMPSYQKTTQCWDINYMIIGSCDLWYYNNVLAMWLLLLSVILLHYYIV